MATETSVVPHNDVFNLALSVITKITQLSSKTRTAGENVLNFSFCDTDSSVIDVYLLISLTRKSQLVLKHNYFNFDIKTLMEVVFSPDFTRASSANEK